MKSALGRGLGHLLVATRNAGKPELAAPPLSQPPAAAKLDPGLQTLVQGGPTAQPVRANPENPFSGRRAPAGGIFRLLRFSLIGTDVVLYALVALFVWQRGRWLTGGELAGCVIALGLGAWLSCLAVVLPPRALESTAASADTER